MLSIDIRDNVSRYLPQMRAAYADSVSTAISRGLNKVASQVRTAAIAGSRGIYKLSARTVPQDLLDTQGDQERSFHLGYCQRPAATAACL